MHLHFFLRFHTELGQTLWMNIKSMAGIGELDVKELPLKYLNSEAWELELDITQGQKNFQYSYFLKTAEGIIVNEGETARQVYLQNSNVAAIDIIDTWNHTGEYENIFFTRPFSEVLFHKLHKEKKTKKGFESGQLFRVKAPLLKKNEVIAIAGSGNELGKWDTVNPLVLSKFGDWWYINTNVPASEFPLTYKYGVYNIAKNDFIKFEDGQNRFLNIKPIEGRATIVHDGFVHLPNNTFRGAGVAIPVFGLRSKDGLGIGEFNDLKQLVDWAKTTGLKMIQLLPINDTTATYKKSDSYPYAAISAFALHPAYINLETVAGKDYADQLESLNKVKKKLNKETGVDHEMVMKVKTGVLKEIYELAAEEVFEQDDFKSFFEDNKHWMVPYAVFCYLRDKNKTIEFGKWKMYKTYNEKEVAKLISPGSNSFKAIAFNYFVQYHLHTQLKEATDYAHKKGIVVKGDIPIGIYRNACDAWVEPELYNLDTYAGAPPDHFAVKGQNWSLPTYNWKRMQKDGYSWWKQRFAQMSNYFDAFRIDHILGFFRIWSIPSESIEGIMGRFVPAVAIHIGEFGQNFIPFDYDRYCKPFITDDVLNEYFGELAEQVRSEFILIGEDGSMNLKPEFSTQRKVEEYFGDKELTDENKKLKEGLFDLVSNIILFEELDSQQTRFHFRIAMEDTASFRCLPDDVQQKLKELYVNYFFKRQDDFWYSEAMQKLPHLKRTTNMMICGEDLGMVPHCVPDVMEQLGMLSLEIQRMPKKTGIEFFHPNDAPYLSVITPSTHDMSTIRGWWEEDRAKTQHFYNHILQQWGEAPYFCEAWINRAIVLQHLNSPAMWSIFQLQDLLGMSEDLRRENPHEERINIPADPNHYWNFRMHITLEDLLKEKEFNEELRGYIEHSGR
ncbi:MAG: 4-alpha-glucanotransferase [Bacteroidetes bacterium]|nr:MAG: 4-alpha-glucanotransferase [Bacteroidota bacterium]